MSIKIPYSGIGSRETPDNILDEMTNISRRLESLNFLLRSGGAKGADTAFENGVSQLGNKQIFYPSDIKYNKYANSLLAINLVKKYHPNFIAASKKLYVLHLLARDVYQVLGENITDKNDFSKFIVCWTKDGAFVGGTAMALRLATAYGIPIYNLANDNDRTKLYKMIDLLELAK